MVPKTVSNGPGRQNGTKNGFKWSRGGKMVPKTVSNGPGAAKWYQNMGGKMVPKYGRQNGSGAAKMVGQSAK